MDFIIDCILRFGVMIDEERLKSYLKRGENRVYTNGNLYTNLPKRYIE